MNVVMTCILRGAPGRLRPPSGALAILNQITGYFQTGIQVISAFIGSTAIGVIALLIQLVIFLNAAYFLWSFVFWVIRKIPMLNVRE